MRSLVERYQALVGENARLRQELEERGGRVRVLDDQILEMNQRRQDAAKRIDDLIAQIDQIDAQLESASASRAAD